MSRPSRAELASMALRTAVTALSHLCCSVSPGAFAQDCKVSSQLIVITLPIRYGASRADKWCTSYLGKETNVYHKYDKQMEDSWFGRTAAPHSVSVF